MVNTNKPTVATEKSETRKAAHDAVDRYIDARRAWVFSGGASDAVTRADDVLTKALLAASTVPAEPSAPTPSAPTPSEEVGVFESPVKIARDHARRLRGEAAQVLEEDLAAQERAAAPSETPAPIPMILTCPSCNARHIDVGEFATKPHHTHACQSCGTCWRPAIIPTVGVQFLPGFKNEQSGAAVITSASPGLDFHGRDARGGEGERMMPANVDEELDHGTQPAGLVRTPGFCNYQWGIEGPDADVIFFCMNDEPCSGNPHRATFGLATVSWTCAPDLARRAAAEEK